MNDANFKTGDKVWVITQTNDGRTMHKYMSSIIGFTAKKHWVIVNYTLEKFYSTDGKAVGKRQHLWDYVKTHIEKVEDDNNDR